MNLIYGIEIKSSKGVEGDYKFVHFCENQIEIRSKYEKNDFCRVVDQYLSVLIKLSKVAEPEFEEEIIQERIDYQKNYCVQQMKNEKTSMVLLKYFDEKWVNNYIKTVLFDF